MLSVSRTYLEMPVVVHEFATQARPRAGLGIHVCVKLHVPQRRSDVCRCLCSQPLTSSIPPAPLPWQAVPPEQLGELERINPRARLYRTRLPPDQLNPQG